MPKTRVPRNYFTFVGGKISDSNPLNPVPNSARVLLNVDLEPNGRISRRLGLDLEDNYVLDNGPYSLSTLQNISVDMFEWLNVDNSDAATFFVIRVGNVLNIYDEGIVPFSSAKIGEVNIAGHAVSSASLSSSSKVQAASGKGVLFITGERYNPFILSYDPVGGSFSTEEIEIQKRDFEGSINDTLNIDERPSTLTNGHKYNLRNQGWSDGKISSFKFFNGVYPSNADIEYLGYYTSPDLGQKIWSATECVSNQVGNTRAPNGHYILGAFSENRAAVSGVAGAQTGGTTFRPEAVAFFAGRVWYASVKGDVYFSQILTSLDKAGNCYQEQDPSAEDLNELLDTDGGVIPIPEAGTVKKMVPAGSGLILFSTNGIWMISGGDGGFTANSASVDNIANLTINSPGSIVKAEGTIFFWAEEGIFVLQPDQVSGRFNAVSISDNKISADFKQIPIAGKVLCQGAYDRVEKRIYWSFHDGQESISTSLDPKFNSILIFDLKTKAFWDYSISDFPGTYYSPFMGGAVKRSAANEGSATNRVTVNGVPVVTNSGTDNVVVSSTFDGVSDTPLKVVCFVPNESSEYEITFGEFTSRTFKDWLLVDNTGVNYESVVETSPELLGEGSVDKQATYLFTFFDYKRGGFGELYYTSRFEPKFGFRVSQNVVEVLRAGEPKLRTTQNIVEVLRAGEPKMRTTQHIIEVIRAV